MARRTILSWYAKWSKKDLQAQYRLHARFQQGAQGIRRTVAPKAWRARPGQYRSRGKDGTPITDGVFPESKEFLAGYWIVDVESAGAGLSRSPPGLRRRPAPSGTPREHAHRSAPGHERPAGPSCCDRIAVTQHPETIRSSTCCATRRRRCSASLSVDFATSPPPRTRCRRPCSQRRSSGRAKALRTIRAPG